MGQTMKRKLAMITLLTNMLLMSHQSYAFNINVTLGDDIIKNHNKLNFAYNLFYKDNPADVFVQNQSMSVDGLPQDVFGKMITNMNKAYASITPIDSMTGAHSTISLGYIKADGSKVIPPSCENIQAKMVMTILLNEAGCVK